MFVGHPPLKALEEAAHLRTGEQALIGSRQREPRERETPRSDGDVVQGNDERAEDAEDADVFGDRIRPEAVKHPGGMAVAEPTAETPDGALRPEERDPDQEQRQEVGNDERPTSVGRGLARETEKVPETDRVSCKREDEPDPRCPTIARVARHPVPPQGRGWPS